jgi:hypothetical protein
MHLVQLQLSAPMFVTGPAAKRGTSALVTFSGHMWNVHHDPSHYLCHFRRCPRSIKGRGFGRKDKLVDHLKSRKHDLSHREAVYEAAKHNPGQPWERWERYVMREQIRRGAEDTYVYQDKAPPMAPTMAPST